MNLLPKVSGLKTIFISCALAWCGVYVSACAPGLGERFSVANVEVVSVDKLSPDLERTRVRWGTFVDERIQREVADINGRKLEPETDPAVAARKIFEAQFREGGVRPSLYEGATIDADLIDWMIDIQPGFPSTKMEARASVRLKISREGGPQLYSARYSGAVSVEHPIGSTDRIEGVFAQAMAEAAAEALHDHRLVEALAGSQ